MGQKRNIGQAKVHTVLEIDHSVEDPLFAASFHPSANLFVTGTAMGNVKMFKYDGSKLEDAILPNNDTPELAPWTTVSCYGEEVDMDDVEDEAVVLGWKTKRHKQSCRDIKFSADGSFVFSAGKEGVIKKADAETGKVVSKAELGDGSPTVTRILTVPNKPYLLVGDEDGNVACYDTNSMSRVYGIEGVHADAVNGMVHCSPKSENRFVSVGSMTVATWDIRKEKVVRRSAEQEDEILACCWTDQESQRTLLCGMSTGVVTVWKPEFNKLEDQISRISLDKDESVGALISTMDDRLECAYCGVSDGTVCLVDSDGRKLGRRTHGEKDSVELLDLDFEYRLVTGGLDKLKIWSNGEGEEEEQTEKEREETAQQQKKKQKKAKSKSQSAETTLFEGL